MIKYRPHRRSLEDAMKEAREFETYEDMKRHVLREHAIWNTDGVTLFDLDDIVIGDVIGDDDRIGWKNVRHVCVKRYGSDDYMKLYGCPQCIGMCGE